MTTHRRKKPSLESPDFGGWFAENNNRANGSKSKPSRNLYSAGMRSPPTMALNTDVDSRYALGKSGQTLTNFPISRAAAKRSPSSECNDIAAQLARPINDVTPDRKMLLPFAPAPSA